MWMGKSGTGMVEGLITFILAPVYILLFVVMLGTLALFYGLLFLMFMSISG